VPYRTEPTVGDRTSVGISVIGTVVTLWVDRRSFAAGRSDTSPCAFELMGGAHCGLNVAPAVRGSCGLSVMKGGSCTLFSSLFRRWTGTVARVLSGARPGRV